MMMVLDVDQRVHGTPKLSGVRGGVKDFADPRRALRGAGSDAVALSIDITVQLYNVTVMFIASEDRLDATFFALADPTRRAILARLAAGDATVTELAAPFDMSQPAISKHLKVLERAGLISVGHDGQRRPRRLEPEALGAATEWIERYREVWEANFRRLDAVLAELQRRDDASRADPKPDNPLHR
jgi:DNA-binding transcriptional ArsR family regulator